MPWILALLRVTVSTTCRAGVLVALAASASAQEAPLSLAVAMRIAMDETPDVQADAASLRALEARVSGSRAALLPDLGLSGAATVGSGNVVAGALYPPTNLPTVSGPPLDVTLSPGWQAQGAASLRWEVLSLAARVRDLDVELARHDAGLALAQAERQERARQAGLAWLDAAEAAARLGVAEADLERSRRVLLRAAALAEAGVRPGVERSLAAADVAAAEQRVALARGAVAATRARLQAGIGGRAVGSLDEAPAGPPTPTDPRPSPVVAAAEAEARQRDAATAAARAAFLPRLDVLGAAWVRAGTWPPGSEARVAPNWTAGVVLEVPLLDLPAHAAALREARAEGEAAGHRADAVRVAVQAQIREAEALLDAARAANDPSAVLLDAARAARTEAEARHGAGLVDVTTLAAALVREREAELAALVSRFDVLRAALLRDAARGDLTPWTEPAR